MASHDCSKHLKKVKKVTATLHWVKCIVCGKEKYQDTLKGKGHQ